MNNSAKIVELEQKLRDNNAGNFIEAVLNEDAPDIMIMSLSAFYREPELLYAALEYASYRGRAVTITPLIDEHLKK